MDLHSLARSYLQAGGYAVRRESRGFLDLALPEASKGRPARVLVWSDDAALAASRELTPAERSERDKRETVLLATFAKEMAAAPFELLQSIVDRMVEREHGKDIFRWQDFVDIDVLSEQIEDLAVEERIVAADNADTRALLAQALDGEGRGQLFELIEVVAHQHRRNPESASAGLGVDDLRNLYGRIYASTDLEDPDVERLLTVLVQFAFFGQGRQAGSVDFTHHILADYLAGRYAVRLLRLAEQEAADAGERSLSLSDATRRISAFRQAIGTAPYQSGSLFHRTIAMQLQREPAPKRLVQSLRGADLGRANVAAALKALAS